MRKIAILGAGAVALAALALPLARGASTTQPADNSAPGAPPVYRLDSRFHRMPEELVALLLAHPPSRSLLNRVRRCEVSPANSSEWPRPGYCICFGAVTCGQGPIFEMGYDSWECTGPFGFVGEDGTAVCAAVLKATKITIGWRSTVAHPGG